MLKGISHVLQRRLVTHRVHEAMVAQQVLESSEGDDRSVCSKGGSSFGNQSRPLESLNPKPDGNMRNIFNNAHTNIYTYVYSMYNVIQYHLIYNMYLEMDRNG